jgi:GntR family transcriptional regulator
LARRERRKILTERTEALLAEARQLNVGIEEIIQLVRQRDQVMQPPPTPSEK